MRRWRQRRGAATAVALSTAGAATLATLAVLAAGSIGTAGCARRDAADESEPAARVGVRLRALEERVLEDAISAPGQWRAAGELVVAAPFAATLETLGPRPGDHVAAGQRLGWLVTRESEAALRGAEMLAREATDSTALAEATRAVTLARRDLVRVPLVAPQAGSVLRRGAEEGARLAEAAEILALVPDDGIVFEARVPVAEAARLRPGQSAVVSGEGAPPRPVVVERILPAAGAIDQALLVWLRPTRGGAPPALDRYGTASIRVGVPRRALAVPDSAVVEDDLTGEARVAVVTPAGRAVWTRVHLGASDGGWHELLPPAPPAGTRVVVEGQAGLPDSALVTPAP